MKTQLAAILLLTASQAVRAGLPATAAPAAPASNSPYTIKTHSDFTGSADQHNPFWPIGWVKTADESQDNAAPVVPHAEDFMVTTILLNDPPLAVINGKEMAEGEVANFPMGGQNVVVQLMAVQDGRVVLRWENQNIVVPIHRDEELTQAQPDTQVQ